MVVPFRFDVKEEGMLKKLIAAVTQHPGIFLDATISIYQGSSANPRELIVTKVTGIDMMGGASRYYPSMIVAALPYPQSASFDQSGEGWKVLFVDRKPSPSEIVF